jgi:hypothetical protein
MYKRLKLNCLGLYQMILSDTEVYHKKLELFYLKICREQKPLNTYTK